MLGTVTENGTKPEPGTIFDNLNIPCGCGNRKDIMGAGTWQTDAIVVSAIILIPLAIVAYKKWGL